MLRSRVVIVAGCWAITLLLGGSLAVAGTPRPSQVVTTQRAVVAPQAFKPDDPAMKSPAAAKALSATMVSATFKNTPAMQAFAELAKKSGYTIEPYNSGGGGGNQPRFANVTVTIDNQPFWAAMREVCTRGNVGLYYYGGEDPDKIQLMPSNYGQQHMMKAPASIQGPYLTVVTDLRRINTVQMGAPEKTDRKISLQIHTFAEPKARPMQYSYQPTIDEAVDDNGNSMVPPAGDNRNDHMQSSRGISWYGHVQIPYPTTNPGKRIVRLRGHIDAKVQLATEPWEIADPLKAAEQTRTFGGKKVTFKSFKKASSGQYNAEIVYHRSADENQQAFQQAAFNSEPNLKLLEEGNGRYQSYGSSASSNGETVTRQFTFQRRAPGGGRAADAAEAPDPNKLVINVATAVESVAIPFELVDLPLP
jgi:hypothetical protein